MNERGERMGRARGPCIGESEREASAVNGYSDAMAGGRERTLMYREKKRNEGGTRGKVIASRRKERWNG